MKSRALAAGVSGLLASGLVATGLLVGGGVSTAAAAPQQIKVDKTLNFLCPFPLLGLQTLPTRIQATFNIPDVVGDSVTTTDFKAIATVPAPNTVGLREIGAVTLGGTADALVVLGTGGSNLNIKLSGLSVGTVTLPADAPFTMDVTGAVPEFAPDAGTTTITMKSYTAKVAPKKADGSLTGIGDIVSPCELAPGQSGELASFQIGGGPTSSTTSSNGGTVKYGYNIAGKSTLKNFTGDVPITGGIDAELTLATGKFTGNLALNPTTATLSAWGFLPTVSKIAFASIGQTTGAVAANGVLTSNSKVDIKLPGITVFGFPISQSPECKTVTPSDINLTSGGEFDVVNGSKLTGTYAISKVQGCGFMNDFISGFVAADGNKLDLNLTAKK